MSSIRPPRPSHHGIVTARPPFRRRFGPHPLCRTPGRRGLDAKTQRSEGAKDKSVFRFLASLHLGVLALSGCAAPAPPGTGTPPQAGAASPALRPLSQVSGASTPEGPRSDLGGPLSETWGLGVDLRAPRPGGTPLKSDTSDVRGPQKAPFPPPGRAPQAPAGPPEVLTLGGGTTGEAHPPPPPQAPAPAKPPAARLRDALLRQLERESAERPNDARLQQQIVLVHLLREDWPAAAQAIQRLEARDDTWRLLAAALESRVGKNPEAAALLEEVRRRWRAAAPLEIRRAVLCQKVVDFGRYLPLPPGRTFAANDALVLYLEIDNAVPELAPSGETRLALHYDLELLDPTGQRVATPTWDAYPRDDVRTLTGYINDVCVPYLIYVPEGLRPGTHTLRVTVTDPIGRKQGSATVELPVRGP